jgi:hypothetical protein
MDGHIRTMQKFSEEQFNFEAALKIQEGFSRKREAASEKKKAAVEPAKVPARRIPRFPLPVPQYSTRSSERAPLKKQVTQGPSKKAKTSEGAKVSAVVVVSDGDDDGADDDDDDGDEVAPKEQQAPLYQASRPVIRRSWTKGLRTILSGRSWLRRKA